MPTDLVDGHISQEEYSKTINQIISFLEGKHDEIIKKIDEEIAQKSANLEFEAAAILRDRKIAIQNLMERQIISNISENSIDVIGLYKDGNIACVQVFSIRQGKIIGRQNHILKEINDLKENQILEEFIKQFYEGENEFPNKIMIRYELDDLDLIQKWLNEKSGKRIEIKIPKKGEKVRFIEMAENNSKITLLNELNSKYSVGLELKKALSLEKIPIKFECYDISNISGTNIVAGMVAFVNGNLKKNLSRKFKITDFTNQNDPGCMKEVIERRFSHEVDDKKFGEYPDIIFVDGGITQIKACKEALENKSVNIPVFGMVKDDKHRTKCLIDVNRVEIDLTNDLKNLITNAQDEVHKVAISYHKTLREKQMLKSELDNIKGIGEVKRKELLKKFGSIEEIKNAKVEELTKIKGITEKLAKEIKNGIE